MFSHFRRLIGDPSKEEVSNRDLQDHMIPSLDYLATKLQYLVREDDFAIHLVAGRTEYVLPGDLLWILWTSWNNLRLTPASQYKWDRDDSNFRTAAASTPDQYATQGNQILMFPPPDAASIATAGYLKMRYIATPSGVEPGGPIEMFDTDIWIALYESAIRYLIAHPTDENLRRIEGYERQVSKLLPVAVSRNTWQIQQYEPVIRPYQERSGGAR